MKRILLALVLVATVIGGVFVARPVYAECDEKVETSVLNGDEACKGEKGEGIKALIVLIINILMAGAGLLGLIGVVIAGIQYLTAAGNEEKTRKAKRRVVEIVLGVVAFLALASIMKFLIPNFGN